MSENTYRIVVVVLLALILIGVVADVIVEFRQGARDLRDGRLPFGRGGFDRGGFGRGGDFQPQQDGPRGGRGLIPAEALSAA